MEIALLIIGATIGWLVTHIYSVRNGREQKAVFNKLSSEIRQIIFEDKRASLSVAELNQLLTERTVDGESQEPLPYVRCPKCGSDDLKRKQYYDSSNDTVSYNIRCEECRWTESTKWYDEAQTRDFSLWKDIEDIK